MDFLQQYCVDEVPNTIYYVPDFITAEKEQFLLKKVYAVPKTKWRQLANRRLQNWGGLPHPKGMIAEATPLWLEDCSDMLQKFMLFGSNRANHVLVNEYAPGQGIMPHTDGPLYFPTVATISLGCHTVLDFYKPSVDNEVSEKKYTFSLFLEPRSLILIKDEMYEDHLHGIDETTEDNFNSKCIKNKNLIGNSMLSENLTSQNFTLPRLSTRVSLTIRYVPKTSKFKFKT